MYVPCILSCTAVLTWFKSMRMLFGRLKKKSGQAVKPTTARQVWTLTNFQFLEAHLTIRMDTHQLGKVVVPALPADKEEEGGDDDDADAASLTSARSSTLPPSTQPSTSQAGPSKPCDRRPRAATSTSSGKQVDEAILKLAEHLLPVDGPGGMQAFQGAEDRLHLRLLQHGGALQDTPGPAAGTSSSSLTACTASNNAATAAAVGFCAPL